MNNTISKENDFSYLKRYANFLLENHLKDGSLEIIKIVREIQIPLLKSFHHLKEEKLHEHVEENLKTFLTNIRNETAIEASKENLKKEGTSELNIPKESLSITDIILFNSARKRMLLKFLSGFEQDPDIKNKIIEELEIFYSQTEELILNSLYGTQQDKLEAANAKLQEQQVELERINKELVDTNEALTENAEKLRLLVDAIRDYAIIMLSADGKVVTWNSGAQKIKGYEAEEVIGEHFSKFYPKEVAEKGFPEYELKKAIEHGRFEDEGWRIKKDGSSFWANVTISPIYNSEGVLIGFSKVIRDLSEKKKNEELTKKNEELLKINNDLDNFIYTASHDLKGPVVNLQGLINVLKKQLQQNTLDKDDKVLEMIDRSVLKFIKTINDLTEITKVQRETDEPHEQVSFKELTNDIKTEIYQLIKESEATIIEDIQVPRVHLSKKNLRSILYNLLTNAIKYRSPERLLIINIQTYQEENLTVLEVRDNGLGLGENQLPKIFTMFKRMHSHIEGTGIGLYIVKRIVENNGGKIEVESELDKGTTFKVFFLNNPKLK